MNSAQQSVEFVALWSAHSRRVYAYIYSLVANWSDADDIFQETSIVLFQKFHEFVPGSSFPAWACRVAYLKALESFKAGRLLQHIDQRFLEAIDDQLHSSAQAWEPQVVALEKCLAKLPARQRQLIELRYQRGESVKSVAEKVGRSAALVYKTLSRIHETLLECIRRRMTEGARS